MRLGGGLGLWWKANSRKGLPVSVLLVLGMVLAGALVTSGAPKKQAAVTFAVIGDRTGGAVEGVFEEVLEDVAFLKPDLMLTVGDHIEGYEVDSASVEAQWDYVVGLLDATGIEYHLTPGNHDIWDAQSRRIYVRRFGGPDAVFGYRDNLFVILDVATLFTAEALPPEKIRWLRRVLKKAPDYSNVFVIYHKPFWCEDFSAGRSQALHDLFKEYGVKAVFTGHYHRHFYAEQDGIRYFGVSSSGGALPRWSGGLGAFYSYLWVRVVGESLQVRVLEPGLGKPVDVVTMQDMVKVAGMERQWVSMEEMVIEGTEFSGTSKVALTIRNLGSSTLRDTARWVLRGGWTVEPMSDYVEVPPGEEGTLVAYLSNQGPVFPVPSLKLRLPLDHDRHIEVSKAVVARRLTACEACGAAPQVDGVLTDRAWRETPAVGRLLEYGHQASPVDSTGLRLCYDQANLYVAIECLDAEISRLSATVTTRDAFGASDDYVQVLLQPEPDSLEFYEIAINPLGTLFDKRIEICPFGSYVLHPEWDPALKVATQRLDDRWTVELAIPFEALGAQGDSLWGFNFMRVNNRLNAASLFQIPWRYDPAQIGLVQFK